jgi:hypothetical protein
MRILVLGLALLLTGVARLTAASYFVDFVGGSDFNKGASREYPLKHCPGDPAAQGIASFIRLAPGDRVYFKGGVRYVLEGGTGIRLNWDGVAGAEIVYDGNSDGSWGSGRAILTNNHGSSALAAFDATGPRRHLIFRSFEFRGIGGAEQLPADTGVVPPPRFGAGISLSHGADQVVIEGCDFRELGYWQNQKPLAASSLSGAGVVGSGVLRLRIANSTFARMANGCDFTAATDMSGVQVEGCSFAEYLVWPLNLPADYGSSLAKSLSVSATAFLADVAEYGSRWTGQGTGPLAEAMEVAFGAPLTLTATAVASPAPNFQWYRNGVPLANGVGATLKIGAVSLADVGLYSVVASNSAGSATSNSIFLSIVGAPVVQHQLPVITQQPAAQLVQEGLSAWFSVAATGSPSDLTYQWERNGVPLPGATQPTLKLTNVSLLDVAFYRVLVTNAAGTTASQAAGLKVTLLASLNSAPVITQQPASQFVEAGSTVNFTADATGSPAPGYQWEKNGVPLSGATNPTLTLAGVTSSDNASYRVVVTNLAGAATSNPANLTVVQPAPQYVAPVITQQPVAQTASTGETVVFTVVATGSPAPSYQWEKNGVALSWANQPTLVLNAVTTNDVAGYRVIVSNPGGSVASSTVGLSVVSPPAVSTPLPLVFAEVQVAGDGTRVGRTFTVTGTVPRKFLARVAGPGYAAIGVDGAVSDPGLEIRYWTKVLAANDNWGGTFELMMAAKQVGATPWPSPDSQDAAMIVTLSPGTYDIVAHGVGGSSGKALIELYELP